MRNDARSESRDRVGRLLSRLLQLVERAAPYYAYSGQFCPSFSERTDRKSSPNASELEDFRRW